MKFFTFDTLTVAVLFLSQSKSVLSHPQPITEDIQLLSREQAEALDKRNANPFADADVSDLWKRKGGGGGGGKGGGSSGGSGKGGSGSSSGYVSSGSTSGSSQSGSSSGSGNTRGVGSSTSSSSRQGSSAGAAGTKSNPYASTGVARVDGGSASSISSLWDRRRGFGGFGGFRGFSGFRSSGSSSSSGKSLKPKSNSKSSSSSSGKGSSTSNSGGSTKTGSGVTPNYGGGRYYGGGATTPYTSGVRSPLGIAPVFLGVGLLSIYPGLWLYGAYSYPYTHPYTFRNRTANSTNTTTTRRDLGFDVVMIRQTSDEGVNETKPVTCLCAAYSECGCDDNGNTTFLDSIVGDGTYANLNQSLVTVADVNGTSTILLNGTLPNGTTSSGGTEDANAAIRMGVEMSGYWVMIALVMARVYLV